MKKVIKLSLIVFSIICFMSNVYAMTTCNVELSTSSAKVSKNEEFVVSVRLSNVQTDEGANMFQLTLSYDNECLEIVKMQGQNDWSTPRAGSSYNPANGKMILEKDGFAKSDEVILKITFKVIDDSKANVSIALNNVKVSDGDALTTLSNVKRNIEIEGGEQTPPDETSGEISDDTSNEAPDDESDETSDNTTGETSEDASNETTDKAKDETKEETAKNEEKKAEESPNIKSNNSFILGVNKDKNTKNLDSNISNETLPKAGNGNIILIIVIIIILIILVVILCKELKQFKTINKNSRHGR